VIQWLFKKGMAVYRLDERFDSIDRRFDQIDKRFELIDLRFEQVDRRFEQVDKRFEQVDRRLEKLDGRIDRLESTVSDHTLRLDRIETKFDAALEMRERVAVLEAILGRRRA
jgi:archaellum component FlaC